MSKSKVLPKDWSQEAEQVPVVTVKSDLQEAKNEYPAWFWVAAIFAIAAGAVTGFTWGHLIDAYIIPVFFAIWWVFGILSGTSKDEDEDEDEDEDDSSLNFSTSYITFDFVDPRSPWFDE